MLKCLFDPIGCVQTTVAGWWASIPLEWLLGAAFVLGLMVGAALGRWGVAALLGVLGGVALFRWVGGKPVSTDEQYGTREEVRNTRRGKETQRKKSVEDMVRGE